MYGPPGSGPRGAPVEPPEPPESALRAPSYLLAGGSLVLFIGWSIGSRVEGWGFFFLVGPFLPVALALHAVAWYRLGHYALRASAGRSVVFAAFVASLLAFGLAFSTLPRAFPSASSSLYAALLFPLVPWVWAPVVVAHAILFHAASRALPSTVARAWGRTGSVALAATATAGLLAQVFVRSVGTWMFALAGLTFVGYLILAAAWSQGERPPSVRPSYRGERGFAA